MSDNDAPTPWRAGKEHILQLEILDANGEAIGYIYGSDRAARETRDRIIRAANKNSATSCKNPSPNPRHRASIVNPKS